MTNDKNPMVTLDTERLTLRMFRQEDIDAYAAMCADPEVMRFLGGKTLSRHDAWRSMAGVCGHWELRGYGMWAVVEKSSGEMIGRVGCLNPEGWPGFEVGWTLRREFWHRGYATEAARASIDWAFRHLKVPHIISLITPLNVRSVAVAKRLGEEVEGKTRVLDYDVQIYGIDRDSWHFTH
jgi:RimJ/RimL family protein N-acetyltransferase